MSNKGDMSVREAGKKGGDYIRDTYGLEFYGRIGREGGKATKEKHGSAHYSKIGAAGGQTTASRYDTSHFEEIGKRGGAKMKELIAEGKRLEAKGDA